VGESDCIVGCEEVVIISAAKRVHSDPHQVLFEMRLDGRRPSTRSFVVGETDTELHMLVVGPRTTTMARSRLI